MKMGLAALAFLFFGTSSHATIVRVETLPEMAQSADIIAHVLVGEKTSSFDREGRLVDLTSAQVIQGLKGTKAGQVLKLYQVAGIIGQSSFASGEEMVIFGMRHGDKVVSYGVGLGKFKVLRGRGRTSVIEEFHDLLSISADHDLSAPVARNYNSLPQFINEVQNAVQAPLRVIQTGPKALRR